jgi:adenylate cyclase
MVKPDTEFQNLWHDDTLAEVKAILRVTSNWMAIPLFQLFWIADLIYAPDLKWQLLTIRLLIIPICLIVSFYVGRLETFRSAQLVAAFYAISLALGINLMIFLIPDPGSGYYAGLNLVAIGALSFIPFSRSFYALTTIGIYAPFYLIECFKIKTDADFKSVFVNSFFILSSVCICFLIRFFHENSRAREIKAKISLKNELQNREEIIRIKTEDAVRLNSLYSQFSPQIVESIKSGKLKLDAGGQRAQICSIFIDIVNSTERVTRIDKDKVEKVLSKFLDDTIGILLKYDITIDKFLGDGILAFCNAPLPRRDYVSRVVNAAIEIRQKINQDQEFFERYWQAPLQIRVGIAKGFVNVGFYGSQKYFRSYTAVGAVVNLASRLCTSAEPGQIVVDFDVYEIIKDDFEIESLGKKNLKGFESDVIHTFQVKASQHPTADALVGVNDCKECGGILSFENNDKGQFVLICKSCSEVLGGNGASNIQVRNRTAS